MLTCFFHSAALKGWPCAIISDTLSLRPHCPSHLLLGSLAVGGATIAQSSGGSGLDLAPQVMTAPTSHAVTSLHGLVSGTVLAVTSLANMRSFCRPPNKPPSSRNLLFIPDLLKKELGCALRLPTLIQRRRWLCLSSKRWVARRPLKQCERYAN